MSSAAAAAVGPSDLAAKPSSWFAHLPSPKSTPAGMSVDDLRAALQSQAASSQPPHVLVVDVRRADIEVRRAQPLTVAYGRSIAASTDTHPPSAR
jgi:hypothetical protein